MLKAMMKMDKNMSKEEKNQRVEEIMVDVRNIYFYLN
jgi:hypothetical protein